MILTHLVNRLRGGDVLRVWGLERASDEARERARPAGRNVRARMADLEQSAKPLSVARLDDSLKRGLQGKKVSEVTKP